MRSHNCHMRLSSLNGTYVVKLTLVATETGLLTPLPRGCTWSRRCRTCPGWHGRHQHSWWWTSRQKEMKRSCEMTVQFLCVSVWMCPNRSPGEQYTAQCRQTWQAKTWTHLGHTHLVGGQGSGLVRADDGGATQGLHRGQRADNGVLLGHTAGTESQAGSDDSGQTW